MNSPPTQPPPAGICEKMPYLQIIPNIWWNVYLPLEIASELIGGLTISIFEFLTATPAMLPYNALMPDQKHDPRTIVYEFILYIMRFFYLESRFILRNTPGFFNNLPAKTPKTGSMFAPDNSALVPIIFSAATTILRGFFVLFYVRIVFPLNITQAMLRAAILKQCIENDTSFVALTTACTWRPFFAAEEGMDWRTDYPKDHF